MIRGSVSSDLEAILKLHLLGERGTEEEIEAVIDTGFNGFLTLPMSVIDKLSLSWLYRQQGELADGSLHVFDVFEATVIWSDASRSIEVEAAETEPLLGMALLQGHELRISVAEGGSVSIESLP
jgi:clan AA aspartic protease